MPQNFKSLTRVGVKRRRVETSQNLVPKNVGFCDSTKVPVLYGVSILGVPLTRLINFRKPFSCIRWPTPEQFE